MSRGETPFIAAMPLVERLLIPLGTGSPYVLWAFSMTSTKQWESLCLVRAFPFLDSAWQMKRLNELWNLEVTSGYSLSAYPGHNRGWDGSCFSWAPDQLKKAASIGWFENWGHNQFGKHERLCHMVTPDPFACLIYRQGVKFLSPLLAGK